jgi:hypothetical protein
MKKAEELKLYAPEPKRPELDAALCMSVAEGQGMGLAAFRWHGKHFRQEKRILGGLRPR